MTALDSSARHILISGYYGFDNIGDELILTTLIQHLRQWGFTPLVLSADPEATTRTYGVPAILRTDLLSIWQALSHSHAMISGGGGLFQDVTGPASPFYYGGLIGLAKLRHLPVAIFGQGLGPLTGWASLNWMPKVLSWTQLRVFRDVESQQLAQSLCKQPIHLMGDTVWSLTLPTSESASGLGVSLRPWHSLSDSALDQLALAISQNPLAQARGVNCLNFQPSQDTTPLGKLEQRLKAAGIRCQWYHQQNVLAGIAASEAVVAMRFHAMLLAAKANKPLYALAYDPKVSRLAQQLAIPQQNIEAMVHGVPLGCQPADLQAVEKQEALSQKGFETLRRFLDAVSAPQSAPSPAL
jgi:polysaccharide pyruvyl transferase CsaB